MSSSPLPSIPEQTDPQQQLPFPMETPHDRPPFEDPPIDVSKVDRKAASALQKSLALWLQTSQYRPSREESWSLIKPVRNFGLGLLGGTFIAKPLLQQFLPPAAASPPVKLWLLAALTGGYPIGFLAAVSTVRQSVCELLQDKTPLAMQARYLYRVSEATKANMPAPSPPPILVPMTQPYQQPRQWPPGGNWPPYGSSAATPPPSDTTVSPPEYWGGVDDSKPPPSRQQQVAPAPFLTWNKLNPPQAPLPQQQHSAVGNPAAAIHNDQQETVYDTIPSLEIESSFDSSSQSPLPHHDSSRYRSWDSIRRNADPSAAATP